MPQVTQVQGHHLQKTWSDTFWHLLGYNLGGRKLRCQGMASTHFIAACHVRLTQKYPNASLQDKDLSENRLHQPL